jgi:hypothetical protein
MNFRRRNKKIAEKGPCVRDRYPAAAGSLHF